MRKPALALLAVPILLAAAAAPADAQEPLDLKGAIDLSVRWLRSQQDSDSGAYGDLETTTWVLRAYATSPRHYAYHDGPFISRAVDHVAGLQKDDGSVHTTGATDPQRVGQTRQAVSALAAYPNTMTNAVVERAVKWLDEEAGVKDPRERKLEVTNDAGVAVQRSRMLLRMRRPDGAWGEADVRRTAMHVFELSAYHAMLKPEEAAPEKLKPLPAFTESDAEAVDDALLRGARFLLKAAENGRWGAPGRPDLGITAMVLGALQTVAEPRPEDVQRAIEGGLAWLAEHQNEDGSIHDGKLANYNTCAAIQALARSGNDRYAPVIAKARDFLVMLQADGLEGYGVDHPYYGGIGYGGDERPDLSNLQMALDALSASGLEEDHDAYKRAIQFLQRCQNRSESNDVTVPAGDATVVSGDDGGAAYMPGNSPAGYVELADGRKIPRSYGSMTYALLKGYILAGVPRDDPRLKACWEWLSQNYSLDVNPGFEHASDPRAAYQGLFYYFTTMARALDLYGVDTVTDGAGRAHAWRRQLTGRLVAMQSRIDGSWVNQNAPRWWEGNPVLATSYALQALDSARP